MEKIELTLGEKKMLDCVIEPVLGEEEGFVTKEWMLGWIDLIGKCGNCWGGSETPEKCKFYKKEKEIEVFRKHVNEMGEEFYFNLEYDGIYLP